MVKKDSVEFLTSILNSLTAKPKNILEISKCANTSWESTKNALEKLSDLDIIIKEKVGERDYFFINPNPLAKKTTTISYDTYFNLPISEMEINKTYTYFFYIRNNWYEKTGKYPVITQVYKVLAKLNHDLHLNLPIGWYLYGLNSVIIYDSQCEYEKKFDIQSDVQEKIYEIIDNYKDFKKIRDLKKFQYREFDKDSYILKEDILDNFYYLKEFVSPVLLSNLRKLISSLIKDSIDKDSIEYLNEFLGIMYELRTYDNSLVLEAKEEIIETFKAIWELIAINYYKNDLSSIYESKILDSCFIPEIRKKKNNLLNNFSVLNEIIEVLNSDDSNELKKLQGSATNLYNEKSNKELLEESLDEDSTDLFRKFNLN